MKYLLGLWSPYECVNRVGKAMYMYIRVLLQDLTGNMNLLVMKNFLREHYLMQQLCEIMKQISINTNWQQNIELIGKIYI